MPRLSNASTEQPRRIVVRLTNWIGDALMNTPALAALRRLYPEAHITVIGRPLVLPIFEKHPDVDEVLAYPSARGWARVKSFGALTQSLRDGRYDLGIAFQNAFEAAALLRLGGVRRRVGYDRDGRAWLLTDAVPLRQEYLEFHETRYYLRLIQHLGSQETDPEAYKFPLTSEEHTWASEFLKASGIEPEAPILVLNPGATYGSAKRWRPERFAEVARALREQYACQIAIIGTATELPAAEEISQHLNGECAILSGKTNLRQLAAVLKQCDLIITNDSGGMHVAASQGVPVIAIIGSTDPKTTHPWGVPFQLVREPVHCAPCLLRECPIDHRCMERITANIVIDRTADFARRAFTTE